MPSAPHIPFRHPARSAANLLALTPELAPPVLSRIGHVLAVAADPDRAVDYLERLRQRQPEAFGRLTSAATPLQCLVAIFSQSAFLSDELLHRPEWLEVLCESGDLRREFTADHFRDRLESELPAGEPDPAALARFRRRHLLRITLRDVLGLADLSVTTAELSSLADAVLEVAYRRVRAVLAGRHGEPSAGLSILALGKLGGRELNYSSDIDLMFVYSGNGDTAGPRVLSNKEFFMKVATRVTELLSRFTPEGACYRVDLRLRPDGRHGELLLSLEGIKQYYQTRGRDWELQMLIKARVAAGEPDAGRALLDFIEPRIYSTTLDFSAVEAVSETRLRINEQLAAKRPGTGEIDVKLCPGGIRDVEFLVQCLQRLHGGREPWVRHGGTALALSRLHDKDLLSPIEYSRLASAYQFLRHLEHRLQFADDRQTHALPSASESLELLAARLPVAEVGGEVSAARLLETLRIHREEVHEIYERVIHAQQPAYLGGTAPEAPEPAPEPRSNLVRFLDQKAPGLAAVIARRPPVRNEAAAEHFWEKVLDAPEWLTLLDGNAELATMVLDLFDNSPFLSEQLVRTPDLLAEFSSFDAGVRPPPSGAEPTALRRYFRREMFRIQVESICLAHPVFLTLERTSQLSEWVLRATYGMAVEQVRQAHPPKDHYRPFRQMMVIALGRLGMREFDIGSDADLVFVLPDADAPQVRFWTRVAERMIEILSAYTGEGVMLAVDSRLRPNGRAGALVQTEKAYREYFERQAEAWEGIAYMKSHAVAGDTGRGTEFLNALQQIDWRRYGQSGRSREELHKMRLRLEREQGAANPIKAGAGGYYDIDFVLMYLRLKSAGFFFKQLSTTARIDVIEKMGHLERNDAQFLQEAAAFYRALDHGLRLLFGHAEGDLPKSQLHLDMLTEVCSRWTPPALRDAPLPVKLAEIQQRTRELFDRYFTP